jgi:hypothetical protein
VLGRLDDGPDDGGGQDDSGDRVGVAVETTLTFVAPMRMMAATSP